MDTTYETLLSKAINGDIGAFDKLTRGHHKKVFNIMLGVCGDRDEASRLAQEVFVRAYKEIITGKCKLSVPLLIYRLTLNICREVMPQCSNSSQITVPVDM
ncbi:MAG TPA: hypothetical protein GXX36_03860 [Clostridiaceae bacterium]|nr:hypothetical protein [Clostridiaceae bacterium]